MKARSHVTHIRRQAMVRRELARQFEAALAPGFARFLREAARLLQPHALAKAQDPVDPLPRHFWDTFERWLDRTLATLLRRAFRHAFVVEARALTGRAPRVVNQLAADYARTVGPALIRDITETTRQVVGHAIADWYQRGGRFVDLVDALTPAFGRQRAALIAQTESTRAAAAAEVAAWRDHPAVVALQWWTVGQNVCAYCASQHGKRFAFDEAQGKIPAHPRCRCFWLPVVDPDAAGAAAVLEAS